MPRSRTRATAGSSALYRASHVVDHGHGAARADNAPTLGVLLRLLARSATGQKLTTYTTRPHGPRRPGEQDGPDELHDRDPRQRPLEAAGAAATARCSLHPLRRLPERLPGLPEDRAAPRTGLSTRARWERCCVPLLVGLEQRPSLPHRVLAVRRLRRTRARSKIPATRAAARPAARPRRRSAWRRAGADGFPSLGAGLVDGPRLPALDGRSRGFGAAAGRRLPGPGSRLGTRRTLPRSRAAGSATAADERSRSSLRPRTPAAAGFTVHRQATPEIEVAGVRALYGLADTGSVVLAASPEEPRAGSLLPVQAHRRWSSATGSCPGLDELVQPLWDRPAERARRSSPARAAAPTSSSGSPSVCTVRGDVHVLIL